MENETLIKKITPLLQSSTMEPKEKAMWTLLIPSMEKPHLEKLLDILTRETNAFTEMYFDELKNR